MCVGCLWGPECQGSLCTEPLAPGPGSLGSSECLQIDFEFGLTRSTAEGVGGFEGHCLAALTVFVVGVSNATSTVILINSHSKSHVVFTSAM